MSVAAGAPAPAQDGAHKFYEASGAWRIISNVNAVTLVEDFWMATRAISGRSIFSLDCKVLDKRFAFVLADQQLSYLPFGQSLVIDARAANDRPIKLQATAANGNLVIDEIANQNSFTTLLATMFFPNPPPDMIAFALGPTQWFFSLNGAERMADKLGQHCGFTPSPKRAPERLKPN